MYTLREYQKNAVDESLQMIDAARILYEASQKKTAIVLSAPTGAGKTVMSGSVVDRLLSPVSQTEGSPYTILWITDNPSLNRQSASRIKDSRSGDFPVIAISGSGVYTGPKGQPVTFDQETFSPGSMYFLNTQAAGENAGFSKHSNGRRYTVWETINNTVRVQGSTFIVMIDEAHRGVENDVTENQTVIGKVIDSIPIVYGISATEGKFTKWMNRKGRNVYNIDISISDVKASGAIKSSLVVSHTVDGSDAYNTLLGDAIRQTISFEDGWRAYCQTNDLKPVIPLLIVQVENSGSTLEEKQTFSLDISEKIEVILREWPGLKASNIVHTFGEKKDIVVEDAFYNKTTVSYMDPDRIDGNEAVRVVFAKTAIATGWDCPRAEVLVSYRGAVDKTYITQLIGRMIRQPYSQIIAEDESLNSTYCTVPRFNKQAVAEITQRLRDEGVASEVVNIAPVSYRRSGDCGTEPFVLLSEVPTYSIPNGRLASPVLRLMRFAEALSQDGILPEASQHVKDMITLTLDTLTDVRQVALRSAMEKVVMEDIAMKAIMSSIRMSRSSIEMEDGGVMTEVGEDVIAIDDLDYERRFLSDSPLSTEVRNIYRSHLCSVYGMTPKEANRRIKAFNYRSFDADLVMSSAATLLIRQWVRSHPAEISEMMFRKGDRYRIYHEVSSKDDSSPFVNHLRVIPNVIQENLDAHILKEGKRVVGSPDDLVAVRNWALSLPVTANQRWDKHIYTSEEAGGSYLRYFGSVVRGVLAHEIRQEECRGWYNNPVTGHRAITVPYVDGYGRWSTMHPEFILFHKSDDSTVKPSILTILDDSVYGVLSKISGWIEYAEKHSSQFHFVRMAISSGITGTIASVDLSDASVRTDLLGELAEESPNLESVLLRHGCVYGVEDTNANT